jgi:hypothetical protein
VAGLLAVRGGADYYAGKGNGFMGGAVRSGEQQAAKVIAQGSRSMHLFRPAPSPL